jgi:hypothetical protein
MSEVNDPLMDIIDEVNNGRLVATLTTDEGTFRLWCHSGAQWPYVVSQDGDAVGQFQRARFAYAAVQAWRVEIADGKPAHVEWQFHKRGDANG